MRTAIVLVAAGSLAVGALAAAFLLPGSGSARAEDSPAPPAPRARGDEDPVEQAGAIAEEVLDRVIEQGLFPPRVSCDDQLLSRRILILSGEINRNASHEIVAKLLHLGSGSLPIDLFIRTNGGWGDDAYAICDAMRAIPAPVNTWALGACDSSGAIVLAGGTGRRRALPHAVISLHFAEEDGDAPWSKEKAGRTRAEEFWRRHAKLPPEFSPFTGDRKFFLSSAEAMRLGVVDEVPDFHPPAEGQGKPERK